MIKNSSHHISYSHQMLLYPCDHVNCEFFFHLTFSLSAFLLLLSGLFLFILFFLLQIKKRWIYGRKRKQRTERKNCMQEHTNTADMGKLKKASKYSLTQCHQLERIQYIHLLYQKKHMNTINFGKFTAWNLPSTR